MTPTERLVARLDAALAPHGMRIKDAHIIGPRGGQRRTDCLRWQGITTFRDGNTALPLWSIGSWNTVTACLRGFKIEFHPRPRAQARIMVHANRAAR